jgi:hypothetical protein
MTSEVGRYGRSNEEWTELAETATAFLIERAKLRKLTSYTELNATLIRRTGLRGFDFNRQDERAAMGYCSDSSLRATIPKPTSCSPR